MEFLVLQLKEAVGSRESGARVGPAWDPRGRTRVRPAGPAWDPRGTRVGPAWDPRGLECQNQLVYYAYVLPGVTVGFPSGIIR